MTTVTDWPAGKVYFSRRVYPFQVDAIAEVVLMGQRLVAFDTGTGKGHVAMGTSGVLFEDELVDLVLIVAEKNKIREWAKDFQTYTRLSPVLYHSTGREKRLEKAVAAGKADVLVSTYETIRSDVATWVKGAGRAKVLRDGKLMPLLRTRKILVVYDEMSKLGSNRTSQLYKAHQYMLKELRKLDADLRVLGLTATPMESGEWENIFNELRLLNPASMPTVAAFEEMMVRSRHPVYGTPKWRAENIPDFVRMCEPWIIRKRKTDPDVIEQFPRKIEEVHQVEMRPDQRELYRFVEGLAWGEDGEFQEVPGLFAILRQIAGHPASLIHAAAKGDSKLAVMLVESLGEAYLRSISSAKTEALLDYLRPLVFGQRDKVMVFTFFGQSVLKEVERALKGAGFAVYVNRGGLSSKVQHDVVADFRTSPQPAVLLSSDAGARGINVPEATYIVEYESAGTHSKRDQRMNRSHRIDSTAACVHCMTLVLDGTAEEAIVSTMLSRNAAQDILLGDDQDAGEHFITAEDRRMMFSMARARR